MLPSSMDFNAGKPSHIFALLILIVGILFIIILPIVTFFVLLDSPQNPFEKSKWACPDLNWSL